jgi:hypothetical protein
VKGPDAGKDVKGRREDLLFGGHLKRKFLRFCTVSKEGGQEIDEGITKKGIANSQVARGEDCGRLTIRH